MDSRMGRPRPGAPAVLDVRRQHPVSRAEDTRLCGKPDRQRPDGCTGHVAHRQSDPGGECRRAAVVCVVRPWRVRARPPPRVERPGRGVVRCDFRVCAAAVHADDPGSRRRGAVDSVRPRVAAQILRRGAATRCAAGRGVRDAAGPDERPRGRVPRRRRRVSPGVTRSPWRAPAPHSRHPRPGPAWPAARRAGSPGVPSVPVGAADASRRKHAGELAHRARELSRVADAAACADSSVHHEHRRQRRRHGVAVPRLCTAGARRSSSTISAAPAARGSGPLSSSKSRGWSRLQRRLPCRCWRQSAGGSRTTSSSRHDRPFACGLSARRSSGSDVLSFRACRSVSRSAAV